MNCPTCEIPMSLKSFSKVFYFALFPVLDVGTLLVLSHYIGIWLTLSITLVSCVSGILMCLKHLRSFVERNERLSEKYRGKIPTDIQLVSGHDMLITFILMFLFLFPGLLSDAVAFFLLIPKFRDDSFNWLVDSLRREAMKQDKTLEEFLRPKCEIKK